ncbi:MAG: lysine transporter LysE [Hyphococcus sp.]|nr:MAG: lysine transporter LysE [Marinicaulis sp.]
MIDSQTLFVFLGAALLLNITPGPDMAFTLATSIKGGVRMGVAAALGVGAGCLGWAVLTAFGLAALLAASQHALTIIRFVGGAYLLYLAVQTFRHRHAPLATDGAQSMWGAFRSGAMTNLFNPKVGLFFLALLPVFITPTISPAWLQILFLGAIFSISGAVILVVVAFMAGSLREQLIQSPKIRGRINIIAASVFGALGFHLLMSKSTN